MYAIRSYYEGRQWIYRIGRNGLCPKSLTQKIVVQCRYRRFRILSLLLVICGVWTGSAIIDAGQLDGHT